MVVNTIIPLGKAVASEWKVGAGRVLGTLVGLAVGAGAAHAEDPQLVFHNHRFEPERIEVPANQKFKIQVKNTDDTADEFESVDLNRETLVPPGGTATVYLGPLDPGEYKFFGDFHQDTAQGVMVAK
jgi:Cupredoxin-like domain